MEKQAVGKLARAAAFAALLVPLGSIAAEAASIDCSFGPSGGACSSIGGAEGFAFGDSALYTYGGGASSPGGYQIDLFFDQVNGNFNVEIEDLQIVQGSALWNAMLANFPDQICVPIADGINSCVLFKVTADGPGPSTWEGDYDIFISWFANTDGQYGDSPPGSIHLLHAKGDADDVFDSDITIPGSYTPGGFFFCHDFCDFSIDDPGLGGTDNSFSAFAVTHTSTVPEPATLLLMSGGLGALYRRQARRNQRS